MTHMCCSGFHIFTPHTAVSSIPPCRIVVDPSQLCDVLAIASGSEANQMQDVGDVYDTLPSSFAASQVMLDTATHAL